MTNFYDLLPLVYISLVLLLRVVYNEERQTGVERKRQNLWTTDNRLRFWDEGRQTWVRVSEGHQQEVSTDMDEELYSFLVIVLVQTLDILFGYNLKGVLLSTKVFCVLMSPISVSSIRSWSFFSYRTSPHCLRCKLWIQLSLFVLYLVCTNSVLKIDVLQFLTFPGPWKSINSLVRMLTRHSILTCTFFQIPFLF